MAGPGSPEHPGPGPPAAADAVTLGRLVLPVYLPVIAGTIGVALLIPVLPLYLKDSGLSLGTTSVVLAAAGLGAALGSLPAGSSIARWGERRVLFAALLGLAVSTACLGVTTTVLALVALRMVAGGTNMALRLSRQTYIARRVPSERRGRAMAMIGGSFRLALLVGPLLGGWSADTFGFTTTFVLAGACTAAGLVPPLFAGPHHLEPRTELAVRQFGVVEGLRAHWRLLLVAGVVPFLVMTVREGRFVVLPLISDDLGLSPTAVGAVITVGTAADLLLFPAAGYVMDHFGRLWAMVPAFTLIAVGLVMLGVADTTRSVVLAGAIIGIGNGLSSGTMLTFGSDLAPADATGPFLAGLAALQDGGRVVGPLLVGIVGAGAGLGAASLALAVVLVVAVVWLVTVVGETGNPADGRALASRRA
ncbi:MFS transporter [Ilumatobacter sp.]|uniref:MFS transporter n=1 Tax=Ilumatobacter sp. TaxID=1967498 RepID=UPI003AF817D0